MTTVLREADSVKVAEQGESKSQAWTGGSIGLGELFAGTRAELPAGAEKLQARGIACDSRKAAPGFVFFALQGAKEDGHKYVRDAVERGAIAVASEDPAASRSFAGRSLDSSRRKPQVVGGLGGEFFWAPCEGFAIACRYRDQRENDYNFTD
jgi:hypothetical protein